MDCNLDGCCSANLEAGSFLRGLVCLKVAAPCLFRFNYYDKLAEYFKDLDFISRNENYQSE
mgnify:CR=1 FL=1